MKRRLTTVLAADLAGFSRLMALDEEAVIRRLGEVRRDVLAPIFETGGGRLFKTMGDGYLVEFASPVEAVRSALSMQQNMSDRQTDLPLDEQLRFRIGINLGDVVVEGDDLLGDCVNIATRLETIAPVGGICISHVVYEQTRGRVNVEMTSIGLQKLKNIPEPIEVWQVGADVLSNNDQTVSPRTNLLKRSPGLKDPPPEGVGLIAPRGGLYA